MDVAASTWPARAIDLELARPKTELRIRDRHPPRGDPAARGHRGDGLAAAAPSARGGVPRDLLGGIRRRPASPVLSNHVHGTPPPEDHRPGVARGGAGDGRPAAPGMTMEHA